MEFTAIDVETSNPDLSSICQIGAVQYRDGKLVRRWKTYVNPEDYFDPMNVAVHGIHEEHVSNSPTFSEVEMQLREVLSHSVVCHHTHFDRTAILKCYARHGIDAPDVKWLDTARVVRRTWEDRSRKGYGLGPVSDMLGIDFTHHDAEEDARACGEIFIHALQKTETTVENWLNLVNRRISKRTSSGSYSSKQTRTGNIDGPLYGETAVFTGTLSLTRSDAADLAAEAGCDVKGGVTKNTTLLIVGDQDFRKTKTTKHLKAEDYINRGQDIRILSEADFKLLLSTSNTT